MNTRTRPQHPLPAPGQAPPPRGPGALFLLLGLAFLASCAEPALVATAPPAPEGAAVRALRFLKGAQKPDGSYRGGASSPDEVATAFVLGLLSASEAADPEVDALLGRAAGFLLSRQHEDGAFGDRRATCACLTALTTYRQRLLGRRDPLQVGIEVITPGRDHAASALFHSLRLAEDVDTRATLGRQAREGQRGDGGWAGDPDAVETAFRLRILRLAPSPPELVALGN